MGAALLDVERIRLAAELEAFPPLERVYGWARAPRVSFADPGRRRAVLGSALLLTETMAPEAYEAAREALSRLGVEDRIELFQSDRQGIDTARLALYGSPLGVEFIGNYLGLLDRGSLLGVLGHEIGHAIAHVTHPRFGWYWRLERPDTNTPMKRAYAMAAELTADRFGLLACRDLDTVLRLEMMSIAGRAGVSLRLDTAAYLRQCQELAGDVLARGGSTLGITHPEHHVRGYAAWLFSESDLYASITGLGPGTRPIAEVDDVLRKLLGVRLPQPSAPQATPSVVASVGVDEHEAEARRTKHEQTLEDLATDILTDGARRKLATAGKLLATAARAVAPSLQRVAQAARDRFASTGRSNPEEPAADPLDEERRALIARFEELERRSNEKE